MASPDLPFVAKLQFIRHGFGQYSRRSGSYKLTFRAGEIFLSYANNETDRKVVWDVFINRCYRADFRNATVIDVGAHKGYFGAYALMNGADAVLSYEPERENFELLNETAGSFIRRGAEWETRRSAVASSSGEVKLRVDPHSWAHSISSLGPSTLASEANVQVVACAAMADILDSVARSAAGRLIVKIDAEGAECAIVLETPVEAWHGVHEVLIETHDFATCSSAEIVDHLGRAGLTLVGERFGVAHMRRSADN
jgi:FkbM family methyltransferase